MSKRMLIDAAHPEQTRVAVVDGNRVEEFDFESQSKRQLRGNIYLAKITRVEASLQAAFVDYGGNRHGFLAFNEIHPDYYQIPVKDREELLRLEEEQEKAAEAAEAAEAAAKDARVNAADEAEEDNIDADASDADEDSQDDDLDDEEDTDAAEEAAIAAEAAERRRRRRVRELRRYKIQEVIKPGQVLLVQVSKEERGNKGAALTTYLSLAGRYCVLMPNTARGGGISRKISNASDRKRLKAVTESLALPKGAGLIIRTAGSKRTKVEIKRDYEYLGRLWSTIRENTLAAMAPALVHQEGGLVRRAVRDLYDKDIEAIYVEGEHAYHEAHDFMKMLMPSHAARVKQYMGPFPIFLKHQVEEQLEAIYDPNVRLKSGGYLVIHQTEALVAIDVNSGRSTKERNIEATALKTNLEAAEESCRQMRLRDLAGLLVIDFIDMDENKNVRAVEKRMKDSLKRDRARVQMGRISGFGLMEISRQRRRASVIEGSSQVCPTCDGIGVVRSIESAALSALQALEGEAMKGLTTKARLTIPTKVALYLLNEKREFLATMERDLDMRLLIDASPSMHPPQFEIEALEKRKGRSKVALQAKSEQDADKRNTQDEQKSRNHHRDQSDSTSTEESEGKTETQDKQTQSTDDAPKKRRRGRRGGRGRRKSNPNAESLQVIENNAETPVTEEAAATSAPQQDATPAEPSTEAPARPRRRRRNPRNAERTAEVVQEASASPSPVETGEESVEHPKTKRPVRRRRKPAGTQENVDTSTAQTVESTDAPEPVADDKPKRPARRRRKPAATPERTETAPVQAEAPAPVADEKPKRPARRRRKPATKQENAETAPVQAEAPEPVADDKPKRPARRRRKPAAKQENAKIAPAQVEDVKTDASKPAPKRRAVRARRTAPKSDEQDIKKKVEIVEPTETPTEDKASAKSKKSWWSRRFNS
ncbi:MAG: ribonuclease E/G [Robiginitomaculum sp.]|nr:MAG: ribonuclease E/G [Robiginitomaculum sp.]